VERFALRFRDNGTPARAGGTVLRRDDTMLSPRAGLVFKPAAAVSFYGSSSVSFLPSAGDQFASLTATTQTLRPERFRNVEAGAKWDVRDHLALTAAVFQLDRSNTTARDANDPTRTVLTGSQRTTGWEVGATGAITSRWEIAGGLASQDAEVTSATTAAPLGATPALVPRTTLSLWNKVRVLPALSAGLGVVHQDDMYASIDNTVTLPGFTRVDAALYVTLTRALRAQLNVENLLDRRYFATSHGNNNILPGAPRMVRLTLQTGY
jgi:catecholate siderophore receptor